MIVEFVGPSGSGKTTVARAVLAASPDLSWGRRSLAPDTASAKWQIFERLVRGLSVAPVSAWGMLRDASARAYWRRMGWRRTLEALAIVALNRGQSRSPQLNLQDQGIVQLLAYRVRKWCKEDQIRALPILYRSIGFRSVPDAIVLFRVPSEHTAARTKLEGSLHRDAEKAARMAEAIDASVSAATKAFNIPVVATANHGTAQATAEELVPLLAGEPRERT